MDAPQIFASFDTENDEELYQLLLSHAEAPGLSFTVSGRSHRFLATDAWSDTARRSIRKSDQVIVICGEHTDESMGVFTELRIAQEEEKPYILLWGWREIMCTKPAGAKSTEGMFSWTLPILQEQIMRMSRAATGEAEASALRRPEKRQLSGGPASTS
jgi:hypothetical protein